MRIDWAALGIVAVVSVLATIAFTVLLAGGIRLVSQAAVDHEVHPSARTTAVRSAGYLLLGLAGVVVLYGLFLIVPIFR